MEEENIAIRLKDFIEKMGLSNSQFADKCGIPRPTLSQILTGRNKKISNVIIGQIYQAFPDLSVVWLMFGKGDMMTGANDAEDGGVELPGLFNDSEKFVANDTEINKKSNLSALNEGVKGGKNTVNNGDIVDSKIVNLQEQIEKMRKNPRKVTQITVYYDDSTFETFFPR